MRGCAFHPTQPLIVSGGDDSRIKVYNYVQRKCLFELSGHMDYIRTVAFHHELPWILSASDDQTIRIWNWQSRELVTMLTGHSHYVMCAQFHPSEPLVISASLDQTIRVWDLTGLLMKSSVGQLTSIGNLSNSHSSLSNVSYPSSSKQKSIDLFCAPETQIKFVIEGHDRGVNWVQFHPEKPLIISGSDDRTIKLWRYNETRAWEIETFRGHSNNISTCLFHPSRNLIISNSEDKTIRAWDYSHCIGDSKSSSLASSSSSPNSSSTPPSGLIINKREGERFWCLALHPSKNLISAGHDSGLIIFKMEHERPISFFDIKDFSLLFIRDNQLLSYDPRSSKETHLHFLPSHPFPPCMLSSNGMDKCFLLSKYSPTSNVPILSIDTERNICSKQIIGSCAHYVSRNRILFLNAASSSSSSSKRDERKVSLWTSDFSEIISHTPKNIRPVRILTGPYHPLTFLVSQDRVSLFDYESGEEIGLEIKIKGIKYSTISPLGDKVAFYSSSLISIHSLPSMVRISLISEPINIKGCCWSPCGRVILYTNTHHLKYHIPSNSDNGIICSLPEPLYLVHCLSTTSLLLLDRLQEVKIIKVDPSEWMFKLSLLEGDEVMMKELLMSTNFIGQSIIAYLRDKGHSSVALEFVKDPLIRFDLFLDCEMFEEAWDIASSHLNSRDHYLILAERSLKLGNISVSSRCIDAITPLMISRSLHLKIISGDLHPIHMCSSSIDYGISGDIMTFSNSSLLERLERQGQYELVELMKDSYDLIENISQKTSKPFPVFPIRKKNISPSLNNFLPFKSEIINDVHPNTFTSSTVAKSIEEIEDTSKAWGDDDEVFADLDDVKIGDIDLSTSSEEALDFPPMFEEGNKHATKNLLIALKEKFSGLNSSKLFNEYITNQLCTQGIFELLNSKIIICNDVNDVIVGGNGGNSLDNYNMLIKNHKTKVEELMSLVSGGSFEEALKGFITEIQRLIWLTLEEKDSLTPFISECRSYIEGLKIELKRRTVASSLGDEECLSLSLLFSSLPLRKEHEILALRGSLVLAYKLKCFKLSNLLSRRLLSIPGCPSSLEEKAKKIISFYQSLPLNHEDPIIIPFSFDEHHQIPIDCNTLEFMSSIDSIFKCSYCLSQSHHQTICPICQLVQLS